jgi:glutamine amidotransferase
MIGIVNYDAGNLGSLLSALNTLGKKYVVVDSAFDREDFDSLIIPGVGAFDYGIKKLNENHLTESVKGFANSGQRVLGICLGMHLLSDLGEENGFNEGLSLIPGRVKKLTPSTGNRSPHMGWSMNSFRSKSTSTLNANYGYFAHNYYYEPVDPNHIVADFKWGKVLIPSIIRHREVIGIQFHPEKSDSWGLDVLNWAITRD